MQTRTPLGSKLARIAIVAGLVLATLAHAALEKQVKVWVEGKTIAVRTYGRTVRDVLQRGGIRVGAADIIVPPLSAPVSDGSRVQVRRAKRVTLLLNGKPRRVVVTGLTIEEVLREIDLGAGRLDHVRPSRSSAVRAGMTISYRKAMAVTVLHDGTEQPVVTNGQTVGDVLRRLGLRLGPHDRTVPAMSHRPKPGMSIRLIRVKIASKARHSVIPYRTILRRSGKLEYGERREIQQGRTGLRTRRYVTRYEDGRVVSSRLVGNRVVRHPVSRIVAVGTSFPGCRCSRGEEVGGASWYREADGMSAAHRTLPKGTVVRVESLETGRWVNVVIRDRGPYVDGRIIDLSDESFRRLAPLHSGVLRVRIRW